MSITRSATLVLAGLALLVRSVPTAAQAAPPLASRWQYLQPSDKEGEVLDLVVASGQWRGIMNGLLRAGEDGLYYYVVEIENVLSVLGGKANAGLGRYRMLFTGRLEAGDLVLQCIDVKGGSCPDKTMRFKRI